MLLSIRAVGKSTSSPTKSDYGKTAQRGRQ
jgi:hypothetical protein